MSEKNFNKSRLTCPKCSEQLMTCDTQTHEWSPSGGLTSRKGPRICVACHQEVDLSIAIGLMQLKEKEAEVERLQQEIASANYSFGVEPVEVENGA